MAPAHRSVPALSVSAVLLWLAGALLLSLHFRLAPAVRPFAWPLPEVAASPAQIGGALAGLGLVVGVFQSRGRPRGLVVLGACFLWPALPLALSWWTVPAAGSVDLRILGLLAVAVLGLGTIRAAGLTEPQRDPDRRGLGTGRLWVGFHVLAGAALLSVVVSRGGFEDPSGVLVSLALYPLYALVQLFLLLGVILPAWQAWTGRGRGRIMALAAGTFALVHWPNPLLMALTAVGMLVWSREYLRGRPLWALAISMGLLATLAAQGLPHDWTEHMRTGPRNVRQRAASRLAVQAAARTDHLPPGWARTEAWLNELYPGVLERPPVPGELARWWDSIDACRRGMIAWTFFLSPEYGRRFGTGNGVAPFDPELPWADLPQPWRGRIENLVRDAPSEPVKAWETYLRHLYREVLQREAADAEIRAWPRELGPRQQRRVVELLLEGRGIWREAPFDTLDCSTVGFYN